MKAPALATLLLGPVLCVALGWPGAESRGIIAEEIQPYLPRWPHVLERTPAGIVAMPPYEPGAPAGPRWVATSEWPVVGYDGVARSWPVLIKGYQSALGSWVGIVLGPLLGGGVAGVRRSNVLLTAALVALTVLLGTRLRGSSNGAALGGLVLASSYGLLFIGRTGYGFEIASRAAMMATLVLAAAPKVVSRRRAGAIGAVAGVAILCRAPVIVILAPALAMLLLTRHRRPSPATLGIVGGAAVAVPLSALAASVLLAPLRADTRALGSLDLTDLPHRLAGVFDQLRLQLAWLTDATSVTTPLYGGQLQFATGALTLAATGAFASLCAALYRSARGRATEAERIFAVATLTSALLGAALYGDPHQFQLALALEPLLALAVAAQVAALPHRSMRWSVAAVVLAFRAQVWIGSLAPEAANLNPMLSAKAQRAAVARLLALGLHGPEILTTSYQHAGVVEAWSEGRVQPNHAWPIFLYARTSRDLVWRQLLAAQRPRYLLLTEGPNIFETPGLEPKAISDALARVAQEDGLHLVLDERFLTEGGGPGWVLWQVATPTP